MSALFQIPSPVEPSLYMAEQLAATGDLETIPHANRREQMDNMRYQRLIVAGILEGNRAGYNYERSVAIAARDLHVGMSDHERSIEKPEIISHAKLMSKWRTDFRIHVEQIAQNAGLHETVPLQDKEPLGIRIKSTGKILNPREDWPIDESWIEDRFAQSLVLAAFDAGWIDGAGFYWELPCAQRGDLTSIWLDRYRKLGWELQKIMDDETVDGPMAYVRAFYDSLSNISEVSDEGPGAPDEPWLKYGETEHELMLRRYEAPKNPLQQLDSDEGILFLAKTNGEMHYGHGYDKFGGLAANRFWQGDSTSEILRKLPREAWVHRHEVVYGAHILKVA